MIMILRNSLYFSARASILIHTSTQWKDSQRHSFPLRRRSTTISPRSLFHRRIISMYRTFGRPSTFRPWVIFVSFTANRTSFFFPVSLIVIVIPASPSTGMYHESKRHYYARTESAVTSTNSTSNRRNCSGIFGGKL